jgi:hypothetical protein
LHTSYRRWLVSIIAVLSMIGVTFATPAIMGAAATAKWTVMVYLDGDNNLDPDSVADIGEMMTVGTTEKVNVIVLWDRYAGPANLYEVQKGKLQLLDGLTVNGLSVNGQEISMTDWHVLKAFVEFAETKLPADHYMLDLWDHGSPWGYACWDDHWVAPWYPSPDGALSLNDVVSALQSTGMDILTYDGCTIGMAEIAYQLAVDQPAVGPQIRYLVASEEYIPNSGYAYNEILQQMNVMDDMSPEAVAKMLADEYASAYSPHGSAKGGSTVQLSVVDLTKVSSFVPELKALTGMLENGLSENFDYYHNLISKARGNANLGWSLNGWDKRVDLGTFMTALSALSKDKDIRALANQAFDDMTAAVYTANTPAMESQSAYGLGVWFPTSYRSIGNANTGGYGTIDQYMLAFAFAEDGGWMDFLYAYWGVTP